MVSLLCSILHARERLILLALYLAVCKIERLKIGYIQMPTLFFFPIGLSLS